MIHTLLAIAACVFFVLAAFGVPSRVNFTPLGLLCLTLMLLVP